MNIKVSDLREFFKRASKIKSNGVIPIYNYLLIESDKETVSITKTNGNYFVKHTVDQDNQDDEKILVEEERLSAFVKNAKGEFLTIKTKGKELTIKDGVIAPVQLGAEVDAKLFKTFPNIEGAERISLGPDLLAALFEARNFSSIVESNFHYVYTHKHEDGFYVYASNGQILYLRKFEEELPIVALSPEVCSIVCQFQSLQYFTLGNYDFFDTGATVYGFIKTTYQAPAYMHIFRSVRTEEVLTFNRSEVLSFCELVSSLAVMSFPYLVFEEKTEDALLMSFGEDEYNVSTEKELKVKKNYWPQSFAFNVAYLTQVLKCFTADELILSPGDKETMFGLTSAEDKGLTVIIVKLSFVK
jgi:DNA polymerase III sliding clamp (beta) subunit (PCNA family)